MWYSGDTKHMQKIFIATAIAGSIFLGVISGSSGKMPVLHAPTLKPAKQASSLPIIGTPAPTAAPTPVPSTPINLQIPAIGVNANIQGVGMDAQGRMDVPNGWNGVVGWYNLGFVPGTTGSAVIDGHYDDPNGQPAVFWNIKNLQPGNQLIVTDSNNRTYTFSVTDVESYPYDGAPMQQIFDSTDKARLNLITCAGTWDKAAHNYSNRVVVYSELQQ